jgi:hypothetical protein
MNAKSQVDKLYDLLKDGKPHSTNEIIEFVYPREGREKTPARISARIFDVKRKYGVEIPDATQDKNTKGLFWYQIKTTPDHQNFTIQRDENNEAVLFPIEPAKQKISFSD